MQESFEVNFDGLVGPTHHYGGLSFGNIASVSQKAQNSNPKEAALQGLKKMKALVDLGFKQAVLPPQLRPELSVLRRLGFSGTDSQVIEAAGKQCPDVLSACYSASSMWTANAATVAPSTDTRDGKAHFTPANLISKFHRSIEAEATSRVLRAIFRDDRHFVHHAPLPNAAIFGDEGAANHTRFCHPYGSSGLHFFVFGRSAFQQDKYPEPKRFPARQTLEGSASVARLHLLNPDSVVYGHQNPDVIDQGAFHNDVMAVGNQNVLFFHEKAYLNKTPLLSELNEKLQFKTQTGLIPIEVSSEQVSVEDAVKSYLFNSQLLTLPQTSQNSKTSMLLIAPQECAENPAVSKYLKTLLTSGQTPIQEIRYFDLKQSMQNGGGPACLRLRVVLNTQELAACQPNVFINDTTYPALRDWVIRHYRDRLTPQDLRDPQLLQETSKAMTELSSLMGFSIS